MIDARIKALLDQATDVVGDSRWVSPGAVFVAMAGEKRHGLMGLEEAIERGAGAIIHDGAADAADLARLARVEVETLAWPTLQDDLPDWLAYFWCDPADSLTLHAVTGTNGKSSVAWLIAQALDGAMIGTLGVGRPGAHHKAELTTPSIFEIYRQLAQLKHQGFEHVVLEASSHALVQGRLAGLAFETTIFTNLGHDHLDYHGDRVAYGQAKQRLFVDFNSTHQLINIDDAFGDELYRTLKQRGPTPEVFSYSQAEPTRADATALIQPARPVALDNDRRAGLAVSLTLVDQTKLHINSQLLGSVNAYNLLITAQVMRWAGLAPTCIGERLATLTPPPGRMETIGGGQRAHTPQVVVDYAHSPDALKHALLMAREICGSQLWVVFGCGGQRDVSKRAPMGRIAESLADRVVITDDNPRHESSLAIIRAIQSGMRQPERSRVLADRREAIEWTIAQAGNEDVVLIAGKGHETEQIIGDRREPMDDRSIAQHALNAGLNDHQEAC